MIRKSDFALTRVAWAIACAALLVPAAASGAEDDAIQKFFKSYAEAFNKRDTDKLGECWTADAVYMDLTTGDRIEGRQDIVKQAGERFKEHPSRRAEFEITRVRRPDKKTAMAEGVVKISEEWSNPVSTAFTALLLNRDGKWRLDAVHEAESEEAGGAANGLKDLEWLVGRWRDESPDISVETEFRWSPNGAYLLRSYVTSAGDESLQGTQIIGWDPADDSIRSWTFDSDGAFGEESWQKSPEGWRIRVRRTLPNGETVLATQLVSKVDDNTFTARWISGEVEGRMIPTGTPVTAKRVPAAAAGGK